MAKKLFVITDASPGTATETPIELDGDDDIIMNGVELIGTQSTVNWEQAHTLNSDTITLKGDSSIFDVENGITYCDTLTVNSASVVPALNAHFIKELPSGVNNSPVNPRHWYHYAVNTEKFNNIPGCYMNPDPNGGQIWLPSGAYTIQIVQPVINIGDSQMRFVHKVNLSGSDIIGAYSTTSYTGRDYLGTEIGGNLVIVQPFATSGTFIFHEIYTDSGALYGSGKAVGGAVETYQEYLITKIG